MARGSKRSISNIFVWIILLLLIVGLAGFGATSFGGGVSTIGRVGDTRISTDRYALALQQQLRQLEAQTGQSVPFAQAEQFGVPQAVLSQQVALAALEDEADALGLSVGDAEVRSAILQVDAFQGLDGSFDRDAYEFALQRTGQSVPEFEESLRAETARTLLQGAVIAGIQTPDLFVDTLYDFARETRDLTLVRFGTADAAELVTEPTEAQIEAQYADDPDAYTLPERKRITYAWITPETMVEEVEVAEEDLRALYDQRSGEFNQPERRLVERLVFADEDAAQAAADAIEAGETEFDTLVEERGLTLEDADLGTVARDDLGAAADAVFALEGPGVAGPAPTGLGPALFRVNAILAPQETPFEDVRDELRDEYAMGAARRMIEEQIEPVDDLLAGGATLEEIADETPLQLGEITYSPEIASVEGSAVDAYDAFRAAAEAAVPGDFPELVELLDGGLVALRVDEVIERELQPLDEVRDEVIASWQADARRARATAEAEAARDAVADGAALEDQGGEVRREQGVLRDAFLEGAPDGVVTRAFDLGAGEMAVLPDGDGALLLRVDAIAPPAADGDEAAETKAGVARQTGQGIAQDLTEAFTGALEAEKGIRLDSQAVAAVNAQFN